MDIYRKSHWNESNIATNISLQCFSIFVTLKEQLKTVRA